MMNKKACQIICCFLGVLSSCFLTSIIGTAANESYRFVWFIFSIITAYGSYYFFFKSASFSQTSKYLSLIFAFGFLFLQCYGYHLHFNGFGNIKGLLLCFGCAACLSPALSYPLCIFANKQCHSVEHTPSDIKLSFWALSFLFLFLAWIPVFLAYYPGLFAYDVHYQMNQYLSNQVTSWHPPLHTYWLGLFYDLGSFIGSHTIAFSLHILMQMFIMALIFSYIIYDLHRLGCTKKWCLILLVLFAVFPVHSILTISCTKDVIFSGFFVLLAMQIYHLWLEPQNVLKPLFWMKLLSFAFLTCLFRNNAIFGLVLFYPFALLLPKRLNAKKISMLLLCCVTLTFGLYQGIQQFFPDKTTSIRESLSVPCQQIARAATITPPQDFPYHAEIHEFLPSFYYNSSRADSVKGYLTLTTQDETMRFLKLWAQIGFSYPLTYVDAFLLNSQGLWFLDDITHAEMYGKGLETRQGYLLTDTKEGFNIHHHSLFPKLETLYERLFSANEYQKFPVISILFSPAFYFWFVLLISVRAYCKKQFSILVVCCFLLCYVCTLFLAPCVLIRYAYPLVILTPILLILTFSPLQKDSLSLY